jgi:hypothetical protein
MLTNSWYSKRRSKLVIWSSAHSGNCTLRLSIFGNLRMAEEAKQITIEDILSDYHREILSSPAIKLYAAVWFRMGNRGVTEISMSDEEVSVRARVPVSGISKVQSELGSAGLLHIFPNGNETKYKFISDPDHPDLDDSPGTERR